MSNLIKVYNYCYWATIIDGSVAGLKIDKECFYGTLNEETLEIKTNFGFKLYSDECPLYEDFGIDNDCLYIDYYTIDEINGYEEFIKHVMKILTSKLVNLTFEKERGE